MDDAECVDVGGPGGLMYRAETAGAQNCGRWQEMVHLDSWRRCGADREADPDPGVHTEQTGRHKKIIERESENEILSQIERQATCG